MRLNQCHDRYLDPFLRRCISCERYIRAAPDALIHFPYRFDLSLEPPFDGHCCRTFSPCDLRTSSWNPK
jgi:hypothetical protein